MGESSTSLAMTLVELISKDFHFAFEMKEPADVQDDIESNRRASLADAVEFPHSEVRIADTFAQARFVDML